MSGEGRERRAQRSPRRPCPNCGRTLRANEFALRFGRLGRYLEDVTENPQERPQDGLWTAQIPGSSDDNELVRTPAPPASRGPQP